MNAWKHSTPARNAGISTKVRARALGRTLALSLIAVTASAQAVSIRHSSLVYFCSMTNVVHGVCHDEIRGGTLIAGLDLDCKLTRSASGGGPQFAVAENRQRVSATNDSSEVTVFNGPLALNTRYCVINRGKYLQWSVFGPVRITFPTQPTSQACESHSASGPTL